MGRMRWKVAALVLALAGCRTAPELRTVTEHYTTGEAFSAKWGGMGCVAWTEEGLDRLTQELRHLEGHPELRISGRGQVDSQGRRQGTWSLWTSGREARQEGAFVDGLREGPWIAWWLDHDGNDQAVMFHMEFRAGKLVR